MKMLSIEEKAKRYDEALEKLKNMLSYKEVRQEDMEYLFPELKESEEDKIRKAIIRILKGETGYTSKEDTDKYIAWLEKQDNNKQVEHLELKAGHWYICHRPYCCRADSLTVREGEKFKCEKDGIVKGFVIKEPEKYFKEISAPAFIGDDLNDKVRRRSTIQVLEYARSLDTYNQYGKADIDKNIDWLKKQGEQKSSDKVEPKFKVGDWIVGNEGIFKITQYEDEYGYELTDITGCVINFVSPDYVESHYHLWTIADAKDGDVLVAADESIFIYNGSTDKYAKFYVALTNYGTFNFEGGNWEDKNCVHPSTKKQCNLLFQTMKESGYEWDSEKKELKKIETKTLDADKVIKWLKHYNLSDCDMRISIVPDSSPTSIPHRVRWLSDDFINRFKKDFGL